MAAGLLEIADGLYALPLAEFTGARDARTRELRAGGDAGLAAQVKALRKPSTAAWACNQLVRLETGQVDSMLQVGGALRAAQAGLDAAQLRALTAQRRQLTAAMTVRARALAGERGIKLTDAVADQVEGTLTAAMLDDGAARALRSGLLVTHLTPAGFGAVEVAGAVAVPDALDGLSHEAAPASRELHAVVPDRAVQRRARRDAARREVVEARSEARAAHSAQERAAQQLERLQARALQTQAEIDELRRRIADLEEAAQRADDDLATAEERRDETADAVARADARLASAEATLAGLESPG